MVDQNIEEGRPQDIENENNNDHSHSSFLTDLDQNLSERRSSQVSEPVIGMQSHREIDSDFEVDYQDVEVPAAPQQKCVWSDSYYNRDRCEIFRIFGIIAFIYTFILVICYWTAINGFETRNKFTKNHYNYNKLGLLIIIKVCLLFIFGFTTQSNCGLKFKYLCMEKTFHGILILLRVF